MRNEWACLGLTVFNPQQVSWQLSWNSRSELEGRPGYCSPDPQAADQGPCPWDESHSQKWAYLGLRWRVQKEQPRSSHQDCHWATLNQYRIQKSDTVIKRCTKRCNYKKSLGVEGDDREKNKRRGTFFNLESSSFYFCQQKILCHKVTLSFTWHWTANSAASPSPKSGHSEAIQSKLIIWS